MQKLSIIPGSGLDSRNARSCNQYRNSHQLRASTVNSCHKGKARARPCLVPDLG